MKENYKIKEQYNIEKENEKAIDAEIQLIMQNSPSQKDLLQFIQKIREYRTRIYELKMQLQEYITEAYSMKETKSFEKFNYKNEDIAEVYNNREYYASKTLFDKIETIKYILEEKNKKSNGSEYKQTNEQVGFLERVNIMKEARIFNYYEKEVEFWQEMNLRKMMELDKEQHYLE